MTDHPCKGMGKTAQRVFEMIAIGTIGNQGAPRMIEKLLAKGLIERFADKIIRDRFGAIAIPVYGVPVAVHAQWCEWSCEQPEAQKFIK